MSSHLVPKPHHPALVGFDFSQMKGDVAAGLPEKRNALTNQDRDDRVANFVGQPESEAFRGDKTATNKLNGAEPGSQAQIYESREIAGAEFDSIPGPG